MPKDQEPKKTSDEGPKEDSSSEKPLPTSFQKQQVKKKRKILRDRELSFRIFLISHLGILLAGLIFLGGIYYILHFDQNPLNLQNYNPVTKQSISFDLEVTGPEDNTLVFDSSIIVSGKTDPLSTVIISDNQKNIGLEADQNGNFTKVVTLFPGVNYLTISAFNPKGNIKTQRLTVYYSTEKLEEEKKVE